MGLPGGSSQSRWIAATPMFLLSGVCTAPWKGEKRALNPTAKAPLGQASQGPKTPLFIRPGDCSCTEDTSVLRQTAGERGS